MTLATLDNSAQSTAAGASAGPASSAAPGENRSAEFVAVQGGKEQRSGEVLLVEAYAAIWLILMGWLVLLWRKQANLNARLDDLEHAIDRAAAKADKGKKG